MILYLDASAIVKCYIDEKGSSEVLEAISLAEMVGTGLISRCEVAAAMAKAVRTKTLTAEEAFSGLCLFREDWSDMVSVQITNALVVRAEGLAWEQSLRGYDSVHLAAALTWQEALGRAVTLSTYDRRLWTAAGRTGLILHPPGLPAR